MNLKNLIEQSNLILLKKAFAVHSMAYSKNAYDSFIQKYEGMNSIRQHQDILDVFFAQYYQEKFICLMVNPMMTTQMDDYSDIEKRVVNQGYIEERFKKNIS